MTSLLSFCFVVFRFPNKLLFSYLTGTWLSQCWLDLLSEKHSGTKCSQAGNYRIDSASFQPKQTIHSLDPPPPPPPHTHTHTHTLSTPLLSHFFREARGRPVFCQVVELRRKSKEERQRDRRNRLECHQACQIGPSAHIGPISVQSEVFFLFVLYLFLSFFLCLLLGLKQNCSFTFKQHCTNVINA